MPCFNMPDVKCLLCICVLFICFIEAVVCIHAGSVMCLCGTLCAPQSPVAI